MLQALARWLLPSRLLQCCCRCWLAGWLAGHSAGRPTSAAAGWLVSWLAGWLAGSRSGLEGLGLSVGFLGALARQVRALSGSGGSRRSLCERPLRCVRRPCLPATRGPRAAS